MRKIISKLGTIIIFSIGIVLALTIYTYLIFIPLANNFRLHNQEKRLVEIELPDSTQLVERQSVCGNLSGCGNGMDYLVTILVKSKLSLEELREYYSEYEVVEQNSFEFESDYVDNDSISYHEIEDIKNFSDYYVVFSFKSVDLGSIWEWDLRGH